jgi:hypothetical protein
MTPADRSALLPVVDKMDGGSLALPVGGQAQVQYDLEDPRPALLANTRHNYRWLNPQR